MKKNSLAELVKKEGAGFAEKKWVSQQSLPAYVFFTVLCSQFRWLVQDLGALQTRTEQQGEG